MSQFINDEWSFEYTIRQCHLPDCQHIWLQDESDYKHCPRCNGKYKAKILRKGVIKK